MPEIENTPKLNDCDSDSIEEICEATWESIYRFIYYKVQNREQAEDITQETYMKAISYIQRGSVNPEKYLGFLKTIALNVLRDLWRKKKRRGTNVNIEAINPMENAMDDPSETSIDRMVIENALADLTSEQRAIIELRIIKGYSVADTAIMMNKNEVAIRVMQHRALKNLANILKNSH